ncbi:SgcJ/EcaC family oxidoreductase [Micromonospora radicis]|uniref:SgcJ/EcaC family oxidoreductase n=1 Tax=Micromonospora radicis TaxID=1894971 RepID=A0A418MZN3_9ACTN|nr:SgcJ/EcaC family oxidoreductase [Micromonospora radicis]RIV40271.1 SgcJ/EcaC family oxidoreductase [Micromonospora radicis]
MSTGTATASNGPAVDPAEIAALPKRMIETWAAHDADGFADLFVEDGTLILPGRFQQGREAIRAFMAAAFQGPYQGSRVTGQPIEIKPLGPGSVALITEGGVIPAGADELPASAAIRASWILVHRDGRWRLAVYQNCPRDLPA